MLKLQDRRKALLEIIAIASDDKGRINAAEHRLDGADQEEEVAEVD
jgi:hypothetical protein